MFMRLAWFLVVASVVAFAAETFFGSALVAATEETINTISIKDTFTAPETHEISGIVMVPSDCVDLRVRTKDLDSVTTTIIFETWEQPYRTQCRQSLTARSFKTVVFGPEEIQFRAIMDTQWRTLRITRD